MQEYTNEYYSNIYACYCQSSTEDIQTGLMWYKKANEIAREIANTFSITLEKVCGVIAALSPGSTWEKNLINTQLIIANFTNGLQLEDMKKIGAYGTRNMLKAWKILEGYQVNCVLGGLKVNNFYACILIPENPLHVCIDRHAVSIAIGERLGDRYTKYLISMTKYNIIADGYKEVANSLNILPNQLQAITWCSWRRRHNNKVDNFMK